MFRVVAAMVFGFLAFLLGSFVIIVMSVIMWRNKHKNEKELPYQCFILASGREDDKAPSLLS